MIHFGKDNGSKEGVVFIELPDNTNQDPDDYIPNDCFILTTTIIDTPFPSDFPFGYQMIKE